MRLNYIKIQNFRSIKECELYLRDFTSLIGPNNAGKSTVLYAIAYFLNNTKPDLEDWHKQDKNQPVDEPIIIEGRFEEIQEWERNVSGVAGIVQNNQIHLRLVASRDEENKVTTKYEAFIQQEQIQGWSSKWSELDADIKQVAQDLGLEGKDWKTDSNKERVRQKLRDTRKELITVGESIWTDENISIAAALKQAIPQGHIIPAVKDASADTKSTATSSFGILLKEVIVPAIEASGEYETFMKAANALAAKLRGKDEEQIEQIKQLTAELSQRMSSIIETKVIFSLDPPDTNKFLGSSTTIKLDDGIETPISLQGNGVQRSLIFALIEYIAKREASKPRTEQMQEAKGQRATILLFEEPELYMHPHLMRRLKNALIGISESPNWQVIITTHSPFLLDVANDPASLVIFKRKVDGRTGKLKQLLNDPFTKDTKAKDDRMALRAALDFHPTVTEAFFADRVVLVEGDSEIAILRHQKQLLKLAGIEQNKIDNTTIVSCGGKWTIPAMATLLNEYGIPFRIIHDHDRKGKSDEELKTLSPIHPYCANERIQQICSIEHIHIVDDKLEDILWEGADTEIPSGSDKPFRAWQRVDILCNGYSNLDHAPKLQNMVRFAFDW